MWVCRTCSTSACFSCAKRYDMLNLRLFLLSPRTVPEFRQLSLLISFTLLYSHFHSLALFYSFAHTSHSDVTLRARAILYPPWRAAGVPEHRSKTGANALSSRSLPQMEATQLTTCLTSSKQRCAAAWLILVSCQIRICFCLRHMTVCK